MKSAFDNSRPGNFLAETMAWTRVRVDLAVLLRFAPSRNLLAGAEVCLNVLDLRQVTLQDWQNL